MLVKQALIEFFITNNIRYIFQLPGLHTLPLIEALSCEKSIRIITGRHESSVVFMADGYARASGNPGVIVVTPGPGLGNIVSGCMEAFNDDVPLLILHIDVRRNQISKGILHGVTEPEAIFRHITKKIHILADLRNSTALLDDAYHETISGRPGPVLISIPHTFLEKNIPSGLSSKKNKPEYISKVGTDNEEDNIDTFLDNLEEYLDNKRKPIFIGGKALMGGKMGSILDDICRSHSIPFLSTTGGKGVLREDSPYGFGNIVRKGLTSEIIASSDLVIAIGTRLRHIDAKGRGVVINELVHIDIDDRWIGKNYYAQLRFVGNLERALIGIRSHFDKRKFDWDIEGLKTLQMKEESALRQTTFGYALVETVRKAIPENTAVVCDLNTLSYWLEYYFPAFYQNSFLMPRGISPIFYAFPASIGAKLGKPERPCIAICGDGGILPTIGEIATLKQYAIPVVIFIHNNNSYSILEETMTERYSVCGSMDLTNPDFVKIAQAFGIKAKRATTLQGLTEVFRNDITWDEPFLIEFNHSVGPPPWKVHSA